MNKYGNPVFRNMNKQNENVVQSDVTIEASSWRGIITKTLMLVGIAIVAGGSAWFLPLPLLIVLLAVGGIASFILVFIAMRNPAKARVSAILYAAFQGVMYGTLTALIELGIPGVGLIALSVTFLILAVMAGLHSIGAVRATPGLIRFVMGALITVLVVSLVMFIGSFIAPTYFASIRENYPVMIIVSAFLIILGALMLVIDFGNAKGLIESGAPKMYEWQVSLGFMVTLVWIYLQVLRFASLLASRRK